MERALLDITEAAFYLNMREKLLQDLVNARKIPHRKIKTLIRFVQRDLDAWIAQLPGVSVQEAVGHRVPTDRVPLPLVAPVPTESSPPDPTPLVHGPRRHIGPGVAKVEILAK